MGCPVHIWLPAMAAMAPFVRVARDRVHALGISFSRARTPSEAAPPGARGARTTRTVTRFAPVGAAPTLQPSEAESGD